LGLSFDFPTVKLELSFQEKSAEVRITEIQNSTTTSWLDLFISLHKMFKELASHFVLRIYLVSDEEKEKEKEKEEEDEKGKESNEVKEEEENKKEEEEGEKNIHFSLFWRVRFNYSPIIIYALQQALHLYSFTGVILFFRDGIFNMLKDVEQFFV